MTSRVVLRKGPFQHGYAYVMRAVLDQCGTVAAMGRFDDWIDGYLGATYPDDDEYEGPRGSDVVVYSPDTDTLLLLVRGKNPFRGFLVPPSGGVKPGESFAEAAVRELYEETGLVASENSLEVVRDYRYEDFDPRGRLWSRRFLLRVVGQPQVIAGDDAADHRWIRVDDLPFWQLAIEQAVGVRDALILAGRIPSEPKL